MDQHVRFSAIWDHLPLPMLPTPTRKGLLRLFCAGSPLLPLFLPKWPIQPFSARQIIDSNDLLPFLLAPWSAPSSAPSALSRFLQAAILWRIPAANLVACYPLWILIALARTLAGFIFSRAVGWAHPAFFRHWALYEETGGFGPMLLGSVYLCSVPGDIFASTFLSKLKWGITLGRGAPSLFVMPITLCWLDHTPWTYSVTLLCVFILTIVRNILLGTSPTLPPPNSNGIDTVSPILILKASVGSLVVMLLPYHITRGSAVPDHVTMPSAPFPPAPLLEILILSSPRADVQASAGMLGTTVLSYLAFLNESNTVLSAFTHVPDHEAFKQVEKDYNNNSVTFYINRDTHPDAFSGHFLHISEAFRWASSDRPGRRNAEWVMLVEDDFPLCYDDIGKNALRQVMQILEASRHQGSNVPTRRGGFIGTGGRCVHTYLSRLPRSVIIADSGLIIHRSLLPILTLLLRVHAERTPKLPAEMAIRNPDQVIQDCLLGVDPLCPKYEDGKGLVITSRIVMDHIGGMFSTNKYKAPNKDKWRCGWRHPFHGRSQVEVVVI